MFALDSSPGRQRRPPSYNWLHRQGNNAPLVRVGCSQSRSAPWRHRQCIEERNDSDESSSMSTHQQAPDNDDVGWLVRQGDGQGHTDNKDGNELHKVQETADHLTFEYVHQLVAALQEARRHLDSLAEFVNDDDDGDDSEHDEESKLVNLKSSHNDVQGYRDADTLQEPDQIALDMICDQLKNSRGTADGDREHDTRNRSMSTQTEDDVQHHRNVPPNHSQNTFATDKIFDAHKPIGRTGKLLNYGEKMSLDDPVFDRKMNNRKQNRNCEVNHERRTLRKRYFAGRQSGPSQGMHEFCRSEAIIRGWLNDAWASAGRRSWQRMSVLGRDYRKLYRRHVRLRRQYIRHQRRFRHVERQHQILLKSIGIQVDELTLDWAHRVRRLLMATGPCFSHQSNPFNFANNYADVNVWCSPGNGRSVGWQQWHAILSLKLHWVRSSHGTVVDHLLVRLESSGNER